MKNIKLTQGKFAMVDDDIFDHMNKFTWHVERHKKDIFYASRFRSRKIKEGPKTILLHREIMTPTKDFQIDHIDGNGLNCQRENMRIVTSRQNSQNKLVHRNGKLVGCFWSKAHSMWRSQININGVKKHLGMFNSEREAHQAYVIACNDPGSGLAPK